MEGNLTREPSLSTTNKGTSVCSFSLASNRYYKADEELVHEVSYFDIEAWSKLGEICAENLHKGRGVRVVGHLKQDRWQDKEGNPHRKNKIVAEHVEFHPMKKKTETQDSTLANNDAKVDHPTEEKETAEA